MAKVIDFASPSDNIEPHGLATLVGGECGSSFLHV